MIKPNRSTSEGITSSQDAKTEIEAREVQTSGEAVLGELLGLVARALSSIGAEVSLANVARYVKCVECRWSSEIGPEPRNDPRVLKGLARVSALHAMCTALPVVASLPYYHVRDLCTLFEICNKRSIEAGGNETFCAGEGLGRRLNAGLLSVEDTGDDGSVILEVRELLDGLDDEAHDRLVRLLNLSHAIDEFVGKMQREDLFNEIDYLYEMLRILMLGSASERLERALSTGDYERVARAAAGMLGQLVRKREAW
jgi:hypothetical protein